MVLVHDRSQKGSSIGLLEVDMGVVDSGPRPLFFQVELRFRIFSSLASSSWEKKVRGEKKVEKQAKQTGATFLARSPKPPLSTLTRSMTDVFLSKCVYMSSFVCP
jgi:hypothetical protein